MKPNFLLGVGCQKGGTSWLYRYLNTHPNVKMSPTKEMHIFDAIFLPEYFGVFYGQCLKRVHRRLSRILQEGVFDPRLNAELLHEGYRMNIYHDIQQYRNYFQTLVRESSEIRVVGEITPAYAALDTEHFRKIRAMMERDFKFKIIFLMRDPIDRIQSQQRMVAKKNDEENPLGEILNTYESFTHERAEMRTRYDKTIQNLEQVFQPDEIFYGFYETLFTSEEINRLCSFLEIECMPAEFDKPVNDAPRLEQETDPEILKEARRYYDTTYRFCAERFSEAFIRKIWANY